MQLLDESFYGKQIAAELGMNKATVSRKIKYLIDNDYVTLNVYSSSKIYALTEKGKTAISRLRVASSSVRPTSIRVHAMNVTMDIISETPGMEWDTVNQKFKNWKPTYKYLPNGVGVTIQKNPKSVTVFIHSRDIKEYGEGFNLALRATHYVAHYLSENGIRCDIYSARIVNQHYAVGDEAAKPIVDDGLRPTVGLGRYTTPLLPKDKPKEAVAWVDKSEGYPEVESNDLTYAVRYIKMPEIVAQTQKDVAELSKQTAYLAECLTVHIPALKGITKITNRLDRILSQKRIVDFR